MSEVSEKKMFHCPGIDNALLVFDSFTKEDFLPSVAYMADGEIKDTMFDAFYFTKVDHFMPADINAWKEFIDKEFADGYSLDALNSAVEEVKTVLNMPDYQVTVFFTAFPPHKQKGITSCGDLSFNLESLEDKKAALKWQADEQIRRFNEKNYKNLKIGGFHWPVEDAPVLDPDMFYLTEFFTNYVRSFGMKTNWGPYFLAAGHNCHKQLGFDLGVMQPNYFSQGSPNAGGVDRLRAAAQIMTECDMGFSPELESNAPGAVRVFKDYLRYGKKYGYMDAYHVWYMVSGPNYVRELCESKDPFIRSAYDESYRFIKNTLEPDSVLLEMT